MPLPFLSPLSPPLPQSPRAHFPPSPLMPITVASRRNLAARALDPCSTTILELSPSMEVYTTHLT
jgi:hypothetical protein